MNNQNILASIPKKNGSPDVSALHHLVTPSLAFSPRAAAPSASWGKSQGQAVGFDAPRHPHESEVRMAWEFSRCVWGLNMFKPGLKLLNPQYALTKSGGKSDFGTIWNCVDSLTLWTYRFVLTALDGGCSLESHMEPKSLLDHFINEICPVRPLEGHAFFKVLQLNSCSIVLCLWYSPYHLFQSKQFIELAKYIYHSLPTIIYKLSLHNLWSFKDQKKL